MKIVSENNAICRDRVGRNFGVAQFSCTAARELCRGCDVCDNNKAGPLSAPFGPVYSVRLCYDVLIRLIAFKKSQEKLFEVSKQVLEL